MTRFLPRKANTSRIYFQPGVRRGASSDLHSIARMSGLEGDDDNDVVLARDPDAARARRYCVVFYNDDYTTKWFVVHVLEQFFHMTKTRRRRS
jgi:hypothetical protein